MPPCVGIVRRDANQPMHAGLGLEPAIGVCALDLKGRGFQPRFLAGVRFDQLDLIALIVGPAHIHAEQHFGPILAFRAACARVDFEERIVGIGLAREQGLDLALLGFVAQRGDAAFRIGDNFRIALFFAQLDERHSIVEPGFEVRIGVDGGFEMLTFAHELLRARGIAPEVGVFRELVQFLKAGIRFIPVKDAS